MAAKLRIDFVSDVACPWCVVGLRSLQAALDKVGAEVDADIHFQPFELNPDMPPEGENTTEHVQINTAPPPNAPPPPAAPSARPAPISASISTTTRKAVSGTPSTPTASCTGPASKAASLS